MEDSAKALELMEKMEALLPMTVYAAPPLLATMKEQGDKRSKNDELLVTSLFYSGDMGGITCAIEIDDKTPYVVSITHLIIPDNNPLAEEIKAYQFRRIRRLAIENGKLGQAKRLAKQSRKKKGFSSWM